MRFQGPISNLTYFLGVALSLFLARLHGLKAAGGASADTARFHPPSPVCLSTWIPLKWRFRFTSSLRPSVGSGKMWFPGRSSVLGSLVIGLLLPHLTTEPSSTPTPSPSPSLAATFPTPVPPVSPVPSTQFLRMALLLILCRLLLLSVHVLYLTTATDRRAAGRCRLQQLVLLFYVC